MLIQKLHLQNFRNYSKKTLEFSSGATLIVGPNAIGKTNILEAIYCLATGKSFRAEKEVDLIQVGKQVSRIFGDVSQSDPVTQLPSLPARLDSAERAGKAGNSINTELEIIWDQRERASKLYRINGVGKRQHDFAGNLRAVLFAPSDIEIVADSPSTRRHYLDMAMSQTHKEYRLASRIYEKALRQRNRLLWQARESRISKTEFRPQLEYWNELLINNGQIIHDYRRKFLDFLNQRKDEFFPVEIEYDHSIISEARLERYAMEEIASATTLVGPHRDDFKVRADGKTIKSFGSRGEQRMAVFTIKLGELEYVKYVTGESPVLLLDDIFSELDHTNRHRLLEVIPQQQTIMTTTDLHLVEKSHIKDFQLINLEV